MEASLSATETPIDGQTERSRDVGHAARGGLTNLLAVLGGLVLPVFHALAARLFGAAVYGLYSAAAGLADVLARLSAMGTDKGLLRYIAAHRLRQEQAEVTRALRTAASLTLTVGSLLCIVAVVVAPWLATLQGKPDYRSALRWIAPSIPLAAAIAVAVTATMANKVFRYNLYVRGIAQPVLLLVAAALFGLHLPSLVGLCSAHLAATGVTFALAVWALHSVFGSPGSPTDTSRPAGVHRSLLTFSLPIGLSEFLNALLQRADLLLLGAFVSEGDLGVYAAVALIGRVVSNARHVFDTVASPVISEALAENNPQRLRHNLQLSTRWVTMLAFPIVCTVITFRVELLAIFGPDFSAGAAALTILAAGHLLNSCVGIHPWVIAMSGRSKLVLLNNCIAAGCNIALTALLAPRFGIVGAALAATVSITVIQLLYLTQVLQLVRVHGFDRQWIKVLVAGTCCLALGPNIKDFVAGSITLQIGAHVGLTLTLYATLLWLLGLPPDERALLRRTYDKLRKGRQS